MALVVLHRGRRSGRRGPPGGCERDGSDAASAAGARHGRLRAFVRAVLAEARSVGVELRYWSPWNEPNHPYFISPQRQECSRSAPSAAVEPYVRWRGRSLRRWRRRRETSRSCWASWQGSTSGGR